ncbi:MAG: hypothetical protein ACI3XQ_02395 [Eubacteriales bacterium]
MKRLLYWSAVILLLVGLVCVVVSCKKDGEGEPSSASIAETDSTDETTGSDKTESETTKPPSGRPGVDNNPVNPPSTSDDTTTGTDKTPTTPGNNDNTNNELPPIWIDQTEEDV